MAEKASKTGIGPCDKCGSDDDCKCGPCICIWCRHHRGDVTDQERQQVEFQIRVNENADKRRELKASAERMGERIAGMKDQPND